MNYSTFKSLLFENKDEDYAYFSGKLSNSDYQVIGVRTPILDKIIRANYLDNELNPELFEYQKYQELAIAYFAFNLLRRNSSVEQLQFLEENIYKARSWAVTDTLGKYMKKCHYEQYFEVYKSLYKKKDTYSRRFAYVLGLKFYHDKRILNVLNYLTLEEEYMVLVAEAWLLSCIAIKYPHEIFEFLKNLNDIKLKRKTISKISDSYRFSKEQKDKFKSLR